MGGITAIVRTRRILEEYGHTIEGLETAHSILGSSA